jgi:hypothetical protein
MFFCSSNSGNTYQLRKLNIPPSIYKVPASNSLRIPIALMFFVIISAHLHVFLYSPFGTGDLHLKF